MVHRRQLVGVTGRRAATLMLGWAAAGCHSLVDPPLPSGAVAFTPPPVYARWWAMTEACAGRSRDFGELSWYVVPQAATFPNGAAGEANGYYSNPGGRVVLAGLSQLDGTVVRHEMLHALLGGVHGHPRAEFLAHCAGVVACGPACVRDAGQPAAPPAGTPVVPLSTLRVSAAVTATVPSATGEGGWYTLVVTGANPGATPVTVATPAYDVGFGYQFSPEGTSASVADGANGYGTDLPVYDQATWQFGAGEVKQYMFDFRVLERPRDVPDGGEARLPAGRYTVRASFGGRGVGPWSPAVAVTASP